MVKLKDGVISTSIGEECIVIDPDSGKYLASNRVGYEMMAALVANRSEADAISALMETLDVDEGRLLQDFNAFQRRLVTLELASDA